MLNLKGEYFGNYSSFHQIKSNNQPRIVYLDFLRIFSIFFVLYNHTDGFHFFLSQYSINLTTSLIIIFSVFTKLAVPMFFVISGSLLLGKSESLSYILKKRVFRIIVVIFVFSLFCFGSKFFSDSNTSFDIKRIVRGLLIKDLPYTNSYWFLYAYVGVLLILPFLRRIAQKMNKQEFFYLIILGIVYYSLLPLTNLVLCYFEIKPIQIYEHLKSTSRFFGSIPIFYMLVGYYIDKNIDINLFEKKHFYFMVLSIIIAVVVAMFAIEIDFKIHHKFSQNYLLCTMPFIVIPIFLLTKVFFLQIKNYIILRAIEALGPLIFVVYLCDTLLKSLIYRQWFNYVSLIPCFRNVFVYSILWCITSIIISSLVGFYLKKNQIIRRFL